MGRLLRAARHTRRVVMYPVRVLLMFVFFLVMALVAALAGLAFYLAIYLAWPWGG